MHISTNPKLIYCPFQDGKIKANKENCEKCEYYRGYHVDSGWCSQARIERAWPKEMRKKLQGVENEIKTIKRGARND